MDPYPSNKQSDETMRDFVNEITARLIAIGTIIIPFVVLL
jgi:hypothetical protein